MYDDCQRESRAASVSAKSSAVAAKFGDASGEHPADACDWHGRCCQSLFHASEPSGPWCLCWTPYDAATMMSCRPMDQEHPFHQRLSHCSPLGSRTAKRHKFFQPKHFTLSYNNRNSLFSHTSEHRLCFFCASFDGSLCVCVINCRTVSAAVARFTALLCVAHRT